MGVSPKPLVAFACGSRSITSTVLRIRANAAAKFTTVVVLPTPPFWFATAITFVCFFMPRIIANE